MINYIIPYRLGALPGKDTSDVTSTTSTSAIPSYKSIAPVIKGSTVSIQPEVKNVISQAVNKAAAIRPSVPMPAIEPIVNSERNNEVDSSSSSVSSSSSGASSSTNLLTQTKKFTQTKAGMDISAMILVALVLGGLVIYGGRLPDKKK